MKRTLSTMALVILAMAITGCERKASDEQVGSTAQSAGALPTKIGNGGNTANQYAESAGSAVRDAAITAQVKADLLIEPDLKSTQIKVETNNGTVTLTGSIDTSANLEKAAEVAKKVKGVKSVSNQLEVKAPA